MIRLNALCLALLIVLMQFGCATSYVTPSRGVSLEGINHTKIKAAFSREPAAQFPSNIVLVRVQGAYSNCSNTSLLRPQHDNIAEQVHFKDETHNLPLISNISRLNPLLTPDSLSDMDDMRHAAANMKADMIALYTIDTDIRHHDTDVGPLNLLALGVIPNQTVQAISTASLLLVDVRTGYIYGSTEASVTQKRTSNIWLKCQARNEVLEQAEVDAYKNLVESFADLWCGVANEHLATNSTLPANTTLTAQ